MGTRNSTIVTLDGKTRVAQYGQWDGYPSGAGQTIADFIRDMDLTDFKKKVANLDQWTDDDANRLCDDNPNWRKDHPELHRDTGADILQLIADGKVTKVILYEDFKNDGLFCEYWYDINLDNKTVTMNGQTYSFIEWVSKGFMEKLEAQEDE